MLIKKTPEIDIYFRFLHLFCNYIKNEYQKFKENSLDFIHMSHTLEHINPSSLQNMLEKCVRTLKVGGYIFIEVPFQLALENFHPPHTLFFSKKGSG